MRREKISSQLTYEPWRGESVAGSDRRSQNAMRIIELAHTLAVAETAVLVGDSAKAVANLKRLQTYTSQMLSELEQACAELA